MPHIAITVKSQLFDVHATRSLFRIIGTLIYREVGIKYITSKNDYYQFSSFNHKFWARKRNVSRRRFFYAPKTYVIMDRYENRSRICPICPKICFQLASISKKIQGFTVFLTVVCDRANFR